MKQKTLVERAEKYLEEDQEYYQTYDVLLSPKDRKFLYGDTPYNWKIFKYAREKYDWLKDALYERIKGSVLVKLHNKETNETIETTLQDALHKLGQTSHNYKIHKTEYYLSDGKMSPFEIFIPIQPEEKELTPEEEKSRSLNAWARSGGTCD